MSRFSADKTAKASASLSLQIAISYSCTWKYVFSDGYSSNAYNWHSCPVAARHKALHAQNAMRCDFRNRGLLHAKLFCKSCQTDVLQFSFEIVSAPELFTSSHAPRGRFFPLSLLSRLGGAVLANFLNIFLKMLKIFLCNIYLFKPKKARNAEFYLTLLAVFFLSSLICFFHIHVPMVFTDWILLILAHMFRQKWRQKFQR